MRVQATERDARLRTARSDLMEARAVQAEQESKLLELYQTLADASAERARLREELAQTKTDLAETQSDLESLADEILAMKEMVLNDEELAELDASIAAASAADGNSTTYTFSGSQQQPSSSTTTPDLATAASAAAEGTWQVLQTLAEMSKQMLEDAKMDENAFLGAGFFKNLTTGAQTPTTKNGEEKK